MTKRLLLTNWLDVLYNAVRNAPGGVGAAARFLTERRGASISEDGLRARLNRTDGKTPTGEQLELLTEHLIEGKSEAALDWIEALAARHGMVCIKLPPPPEGGWPCEVAAVKDKVMQHSEHGGAISAIARRTLDDKHLSIPEADEFSAEIRAGMVTLARLDRNVWRLAGVEVD